MTNFSDRDNGGQHGPESDEETAEFSRPAAAPGSATPAELAEKARLYTAEILAFFPLRHDPHVTARSDAESITVTIEGDGSGLLIGKKGQTLDALQYVVNRMVHKHAGPGPGPRVELDSENYRSRRRNQLSALAAQVADEVRAGGEPRALEPMTPTERRIVHLALRDRTDVVTESLGVPPDRYVVIKPRDERRDDDDGDDE